MVIKINGTTIKSQILPVDKPSLDETLETFSFALVSNDNPMPFAPCQSVQVITDDNETINLFLVSDSVEVYSVKPTRWKHNITCTQNTRKLSKHLVRNSVFTTPAYLEKKSYSAITESFKYFIPTQSREQAVPAKMPYSINAFCSNGNYIQEPNGTSRPEKYNTLKEVFTRKKR